MENVGLVKLKENENHHSTSFKKLCVVGGWVDGSKKLYQFLDS